MASTYSTNLKIELMGTGENSGTWGTITNTNLGTAFEQAVIGLGNPDYTSDANLTITLTNSNASQAARCLVLNVTSAFGSLTATRELIVPTIQKQYIVQNNTTGGQSITVKTSAGTGITVPTGRKAHLYVDGTNVIQMFDFVDINGGTIDGATVGAASASTGAFTSLTASGATTLNGAVALGDASGDLITVPGTVNSNLLFTDATYDIGASGATRPRDLFLSRNLTVGGTLTLAGGVNLNGNVTVGDSSADTLTINSTITSNLIFTDNTYDIGASGATRPRNLFLAGNITAAGNQTLTGALTVDSTTDSTSTTTGSIQTDGGVGIAKALFVGTTANIAGVATFSAGSAAAPAITTTGDTNTGIWFPAADTIAFTEGGVESLRINSAGNVGIGTSSPSALAANYTTVDIRGTTGGALRFGNATDSAYLYSDSNETNIATATNKRMIFSINTAEKMRLDTSGNLGLGVTPSAWSGFTALQVTSGFAAWSSGVANARINANTYYNGGYKYIGTGTATMYEQDGYHAFYTAASGTAGNPITFTQAMTLSAGGLLSVGTTNASGATIRGQGATNANAYYYLDANGPFGGSPSYSSVLGFALYTDSGTRQNSHAEIKCISDSNYSGSLTFSTQNPGTYPNTVTERMRIGSGGRVGIGTTAPYGNLSVFMGTTAPQDSFYYDTVNMLQIGESGERPLAGLFAVPSSYSGANRYNGDLAFYNLFYAGAADYQWKERMRIQANGNVGIGTTGPDCKLQVEATDGVVGGAIRYTATGVASVYMSADPNGLCLATDTAGITFRTGVSGNDPTDTGSERMRIDSSGNVGINTNSPSTYGKVAIQVTGTTTPTTAANVGPGSINLYNAGNGGSTDATMGIFGWNAGDPGIGSGIGFTRESSGDWGTQIRFYTHPTTTSNIGNITERARMTSGGDFYIGATINVFSTTTSGMNLFAGGQANFSSNGSNILYINRNTDDGELIQFYQALTQEGSISVSGTTVSYNGGHLSRYAQTTTGKDDSILKGTVLSNLDEMSVYTKDGQPVDNEQLNKVKVSDTEGDANVAGVFVNWSHDKDHNVDEINMAMTGDMIIRIAQGVTVVRGDLLMSAGDGTAKPQGDDIVRSKTVAKVTSNHITCTYADGSYCVPCVLMAC